MTTLTTRLNLTLAMCLVLVACTGDDDPMGGANDAAAQLDADPNAPDADPNAPDANPNAPDARPGGGGADARTDDNAGVNCGDTMTCTGTDVCCVTFGSGGGGGASCSSASDCQMRGGTASTCDGPEDCDGSDICCGSFSGAACQAAGGQCQAPLCHDASDCEAGQMCCELFGGVSACQQQCFGMP